MHTELFFDRRKYSNLHLVIFFHQKQVFIYITIYVGNLAQITEKNIYIIENKFKESQHYQKSFKN